VRNEVGGRVRPAAPISGGVSGNSPAQTESSLESGAIPTFGLSCLWSSAGDEAVLGSDARGDHENEFSDIF
jgi:hypothetical protein